jgi:hypothetical protein
MHAGLGCAIMAISSIEQDYFTPGLVFIAIGEFACTHTGFDFQRLSTLHRNNACLDNNAPVSLPSQVSARSLDRARKSSIDAKHSLADINHTCGSDLMHI